MLCHKCKASTISHEVGVLVDKDQVIHLQVCSDCKNSLLSHILGLCITDQDLEAYLKTDSDCLDNLFGYPS